MIEKVKFFLTLTGNNLWQFRTRNLFSVTIICLSFLTVGIFLSLSNNLRDTARELSNNMTVAFYLDKAGPYANEVGYVALPDAVYQLVRGRLDARVPGSIFEGGGSQVGVLLSDLLKRESATP